MLFNPLTHDPEGRTAKRLSKTGDVLSGDAQERLAILEILQIPWVGRIIVDATMRFGEGIVHGVQVLRSDNPEQYQFATAAAEIGRAHV